MGAWGVGNFENDDALDFLGEIEDEGEGAIQDIIQEVAETGPEDSLEAGEASRALAAIEILAAANEKMAHDFPEDLKAWLNKTNYQPEEDLYPLAQKALERIKADNSELKELWTEDGDDEWEAIVDDLYTRIT